MEIILWMSNYIQHKTVDAITYPYHIVSWAMLVKGTPEVYSIHLSTPLIDVLYIGGPYIYIWQDRIGIVNVWNLLNLRVIH